MLTHLRSHHEKGEDKLISGSAQRESWKTQSSNQNSASITRYDQVKFEIQFQQIVSSKSF